MGSALKVVQKISLWSTVVSLSLHFVYKLEMNTVIPRLTSDLANELFGQQRFFSPFFWTRLTNTDSANECFSGCAR